ncbi:MAG TPA: hypothetical protein DCL08_01630 [Anaerolineaceae bacterium]|jgi:predicted metalloprotease with PDZ domain|nr:hypothetical protein [Anaerolineaceae bacterium]
MPAPVLGVVIDSNGKILHVKSGSAAESFGLLVGDTLISIDGVSIISERDKVRELIRANTEKTETELRYQRNDKVQRCTKLALPATEKTNPEISQLGAPPIPPL